MGNICSSGTKNITIPTRQIRIQRRSNSMFSDANTNCNEAPFSYQASLNRVEIMNAVEQNEQEGPQERGAALEVLTTKELCIGEHYLSEKTEEDNSSTTYQRIVKKSERELEKIISKSLRGIESLRIRQIADCYFSETDACLSTYLSANPQKFVTYLLKGPPMKFRWSLWKVKMHPEQFYVEGLYEKMIAVSKTWERDIRKDIHRTFPDQPYLSSNEFGFLGQNQLYNVLMAISNYFPHVGYCQGMNFLVAFLLLISGGNELETFWLFVAMARNPKFYVLGLFESNFPLLEFYKHLFEELFHKEVPQVYSHIKSLNIPDTLWISNWFFTLFLYAIPAKKAIRVWDYIISEDMFSLIKVAVALLKLYEKEIVGLDIMGISDLFRFIKSEKHIKNPKLSEDESSIIFMAKEADIEQLLKIAQKIRLPAEKIAEYSKLYKEKGNQKLNPVALDFYADYNKKLADAESQKLFQTEIEYAILSFALRVKTDAIIESEPPKSQSNFDEMKETSLILKDLEVIQEEEEDRPDDRDIDAQEQEEAAEEEEGQQSNDEEKQQQESIINFGDNDYDLRCEEGELEADSYVENVFEEHVSVLPDLVDGRTLFGNSQKLTENSFEGRILPQLKLSLASDGSESRMVANLRNKPSEKIQLYLR